MPARDWIRLQGGLEIGQEGFRLVEPLHHVEVFSALLQAVEMLQAGRCVVPLALLGLHGVHEGPDLTTQHNSLRESA
jgi:hypothetical protein